MKEEDIELLNDYGWNVICESPFKLERDGKPEDIAQGQAADIILSWCKQMEK